MESEDIWEIKDKDFFESEDTEETKLDEAVRAEQTLCFYRTRPQEDMLIKRRRRRRVGKDILNKCNERNKKPEEDRNVLCFCLNCLMTSPEYKKEIYPLEVFILVN